MATQKLTPEQKAAAKALRLQADADARMKAELAFAAAVAAFKAGLPKRLMDAQALASALCVATHVELTTTGPSVRFEYENHKSRTYLDNILTYNSDEYEVQCVEDRLATIKAEKEEDERRLACARSAWANLEEDQRSCIKEFIHYLK
jgi:hypothetical protein